MKIDLKGLEALLGEIAGNVSTTDRVCIPERWPSEKDGETRGKYVIATSRNTYFITAIERDDCGYLGCVATSREARAGEDWLRGNDLPDGDMSEETWHRIKDGILKYELVPIKPDTRNILLYGTSLNESEKAVFGEEPVGGPTIQT